MPKKAPNTLAPSGLGNKTVNLPSDVLIAIYAEYARRTNKAYQHTHNLSSLIVGGTYYTMRKRGSDPAHFEIVAVPDYLQYKSSIDAINDTSVRLGIAMTKEREASKTLNAAISAAESKFLKSYGMAGTKDQKDAFIAQNDACKTAAARLDECRRVLTDVNEQHNSANDAKIENREYILSFNINDLSERGFAAVDVQEIAN